MEAKYLIIAKELEREFPQMLRTGTTKLPGELELCARYECSRQTIRSALAYLQEQKKILKIQGSGSYISSDLAKHRRIAVLLPTREEYIYPDLLRNIKAFFRDLSMEVDCYETGDRVQEERRILQKLLETPPSGILMEPAGGTLPCLCEDILKKIEEKDIPLVYLYASYERPLSAPCIASEDRSGAYRLVKELSGEGYKKFRMILRMNRKRCVERYAGCMQAAIDDRLRVEENDTLWLTPEEYSRIQSGEYGNLEKFLKQKKNGKYAVVCCNDEIAYHVERFLAAQKIRIPEDTAVAGLGDSYYALQSNPRLTTVSSEADAVSKAACQAMAALLTGRNAGSKVCPVEIHKRQST